MGCSFSTHHDANVAVEKRPRRCCCIKWCKKPKQHSQPFLDDEETSDQEEDCNTPTSFKPTCISPPSPASFSSISRSKSEPALSYDFGIKDRDVEDEAYFSCDEESAVVEAIAPTGPAVSRESTPKAKAATAKATGMSQALLAKSLRRFKVPAQNSNRVSQFRWCQSLLQSITKNSTAFAGKGPAGRDSFPLFVVAGTCPNSFCGMQAVLFSHVKTPERDAGFVDFWWIKPSQKDPEKLEPETLSLHTSGSFRNAPGKSRSIYAPLAEKFKVDDGGDFLFGVDQQGRAYIEEDLNGSRSRMLIYLVWQEAWSSAMSRSKFIRGKICYQKTKLPSGSAAESGKPRPGFFSREYEIRDGQLSIAPKREEEEWATVLPPDSFQEMSTSFQ
mmetsp:Transcript_21110/g.48895  ORF Transcript_21110/g.48895 Transcript_21110/m.48895 type:complete len:387 (-) Transcript_21110:246-1406(-)